MMAQSAAARRPGLLHRATAGALSRVLDPTIVFSFDRSGFARHAAGFDPSDLDVDLTGRTCLVTGANSGIGLETARGLALRGATLWMLCRNRDRGETAARQLRRDTGSRRVHLAVVDVSDFASVRRFAREFRARRVDVLVHNAGVLPDERVETADGNELTLATAVLGPLLLTALLLPRLRASGDARIVFVASGGMYTQRLSVDDPQWLARDFDGVTAYAQSKRMQVVLVGMLAEPLAEAGIAINAMHPGWADTQAVRDSLPRFYSLTQRILRSPSEGADTVLWLAAGKAAQGQSGKFWFDRRPRATHFLRGTREREADRRALWDFCVQLVPEIRALSQAAPSAPSPPR